MLIRKTRVCGRNERETALSLSVKLTSLQNEIRRRRELETEKREKKRREKKREEETESARAR